MSKCIFVIADHGLSLIYFLQSDVISTLLQAGKNVVLFTDDEALPAIKERYSQPGLIFEPIKVKECNTYYESVDPVIQRWLDLMRWVGGSKRISTKAMDGNFYLLTAGYYASRMRYAIPFLRIFSLMMRRSRILRQFIVNVQQNYTPNVYADLFEKYEPNLVVSRTPGWRIDRYILREAAQRGVRTAAVIVGWDNPSSYNLNGAPVE